MVLVTVWLAHDGHGLQLAGAQFRQSTPGSRSRKYKAPRLLSFSSAQRWHRAGSGGWSSVCPELHSGLLRHSVFLDVFARILLALEPRRHPSPPRPRLICPRVSVFWLWRNRRFALLLVV